MQATTMNPPVDDRIQLCPSWKAVIGHAFNEPTMQKLKTFLQQEKSQRITIYPPGPLIFNALNSTPFSSVKVVILGQDPYHGPGQAHGLCFSVPRGVQPPPSLKNMFVELKRDLGVENGAHGCLQTWAEQGVLLLNSVLTVRQGQANSHQGHGWETFTDTIIQALNQQQEHLVFLLWGSYAQKKGQLIDRKRHAVFESVHPSPLSAHRGFIGNGHFRRTNEYLIAHGKTPINWQLPA